MALSIFSMILGYFGGGAWTIAFILWFIASGVGIFLTFLKDPIAKGILVGAAISLVPLVVSFCSGVSEYP
jgi:hypothetical protein